MRFAPFISLRTRHQPYMVRLSYRHEMRSALTFPLAASLAEGAFTSVVAAKNFNASVLLMSVIAAAPMFGNIMALVWSEVARGRRKVPLVNLLQLGLVVMIASVPLTALLPRDLAGWVFALQVIAARLLASGIVTIRSAIWRANYPRRLRGQIAGRIAMVATFVLAVTTYVGAKLLDVDPLWYVYLYPGAAVLGALGIWQFSKVRVRRERVLLREEGRLYAMRPESLAQTDETNVLNYEPPRIRAGPVEFVRRGLRVLRDDPAFRRYQTCQMLTGFSFMMMQPSLLFMVSTEMTRRDGQYLLATIVVQVVPLVTSLLFLQVWAPLFDRVHITVFRVYQTGVSVVAHLAIFAGALLGAGPSALATVAVGQMLVGVTNAGGNLAWNLGHNDYAPPEKSAQYMGVHVMLTGLRGCLAPFLGSFLYQVPWIGRLIFLASALLCAAGLAGFMALARTAPRKVSPRS